MEKAEGKELGITSGGNKKKRKEREINKKKLNEHEIEIQRLRGLVSVFFTEAGRSFCGEVFKTRTIVYTFDLLNLSKLILYFS